MKLLQILWSWFKGVWSDGVKDPVRRELLNPPGSSGESDPEVPERNPSPVAAEPVVTGAERPASESCFTGGWWHGAQKKEAHPGRVGSPIKPWSVVVHTTDMPPSTVGALLRAWTTQPGRGNCAHFVIDRDGTVTQLVAINRNANHAGGRPAHGWFVRGGKRIHPNAVSVGIEIANAGLLRRHKDQWRYWSDHKPSGAAIPAVEVAPHSRLPLCGWHYTTPSQMRALGRLLDDLDAELPQPPAGVSVLPSGTVPRWAEMPTVRVVGHVTLDPARKSDPGEAIMGWLYRYAMRVNR